MSELFFAALALVVAVFVTLFGIDEAPDRSEPAEQAALEFVQGC